MTAPTTTVDSIRVDDTEEKNVEAVIIDLTNLSTTLKQRLDGIIGKNFIKDNRVIINYPNQEIHFEKIVKPLV